MDEKIEFAQDSLLYRIPYRIILSLLKTVWRLKIAGLENVPADGPLIVAGNHVSLADGPVISVSVGSVRHIHYLGKKELFQIPIFGAYLKRIGMIALERKGDVAAMKTAVDFLRRGGCLGLFPQGTRSKGAAAGQPKAGVGFLAGHSGAAVVPALVLGTSRFPRLERVEIRFGEKIYFTGDPADRKQCQNFAEEVMRRIARMNYEGC